MIALLERLRTHKRQRLSNASDEYLSLVRAIASGDEVDVESGSMIVESADKTDEDLERDIGIQQERIGLAAKLKHKRELEKQMPQLEQAERIASESYQRIVSEAATKLNAAQKSKRVVELELLGLTQVEVRLRESCLDATLLTREAELNMQRMKLIQQRRPLDEDYRHSTALVSASHARIAGIESQIERTSNNKLAQSAYRKDLAKAEQSLAHEQSVAKQLEIVIGKIDDELSPIDDELAKIRLRKLEV
jgi:hypothetical protein